MITEETKLEAQKPAFCKGEVSCRFCKHFKEDTEYADLGMCQNEEVMSKLIFSFCDSFLIDADFGCKWFAKNGS